MASQPNRKIAAAVVRHDADGKHRLLDRAFALAFKGLVYAQIWEDPVVDMEALAIQPGNRIATIASGGCNVFSYLVADPAEIVAVDLNTAHVALGHLKRSAIQRLPDYDALRQFFADADSKANVANYRMHVRPHLDEVSLRYWEGRDLIGRRRINGFAAGVYRRGLLGNFIGLAHLVARLRVGGWQLLDCQFITPHLASLGAVELPQRDYLKLLYSALAGGSGAAGAGGGAGAGGVPAPPFSAGDWGALDAAGAALGAAAGDARSTASPPGKRIVQLLTNTS